MLRHARALLAEESALAVVDADVHHPDVVTEHPDVARLIDFDRTVAVMSVAVLHFSAGDEPRRIVEHFTRRMVPGSYLEALFAGFEPGVVDVCR